MIPPATDYHTDFGVSASGRCSCCGNPSTNFLVYPVNLVSRMICHECVRGAVMAVARETYRRNRQKPA